MWTVPPSIQFSLVFADVGGVTGVWPWTKVKKCLKISDPFIDNLWNIRHVVANACMMWGWTKIPWAFVEEWAVWRC